MSKIVLRPSAAERWSACSASVELCASLPEPPSSDAAEAGTCQHEFAAKCLRNGEYDSSCYIGQKATNGVEFTERFSECVNMYLDAVYEILTAEPDSWLYVEQQVLAFENDKYVCGGTSDCIVFDLKTKTLRVFDAKFGFIAVEADDNKQVLAYAKGAIGLVAFEAGVAPENIVGHIVQPNDFGAPPHKVWNIGAFDLVDFEFTAAKTMADVDNGCASFALGKHCKFCPALYFDKCEAQREHFSALADNVPTVAEVEMFNLDEIGRRLDQADIVDLYIDQLRKRAVDASRKYGRPPPGRKWVAGQGKRIWGVPDDDVLSIFAEHYGDISERKIPSPAQAEKIVGKARLTEIAKAVHKPDAKLIVKTNASPRLVSENERGDPIDVKETAFEATNFQL